MTMQDHTQLWMHFLTSAAPEARYTHWKQTVFYLEDCITIKHGEQLQGVIEVAPNPRNKVRVTSSGAMVSFLIQDPINTI